MSELGRRRHSSEPTRIKAPFTPAPFSVADVQSTIRTVMSSVDPRLVPQEQIMRCAFIAHLTSWTVAEENILRCSVLPDAAEKAVLDLAALVRAVSS
jgi:hypothetical protein